MTTGRDVNNEQTATMTLDFPNLTLDLRKKSTNINHKYILNICLWCINLTIRSFLISKYHMLNNVKLFNQC
jgi:hypothetical protein